MENLSNPNLQDEEARKAVQKAEAWGQNGQQDKSIEELETAYQFAPSYAGKQLVDAYLRRGEERVQAGDFQNALQDYHRALQIAPDESLKDQISATMDEINVKMSNSEQKTARCAFCGYELPSDAPSCPACGAPFTVEKTVVSEPVLSNEEPPRVLDIEDELGPLFVKQIPEALGNLSNVLGPETVKKTGSRLWIWILLAVLLLGVCCCGVFLLSGLLPMLIGLIPFGL